MGSNHPPAGQDVQAEASEKEGVLAEIEEAIKMKPKEYLTYFEDFIFIDDNESGQKNPFAEASWRRNRPKAVFYLC
jgi:hypothetical protein